MKRRRGKRRRQIECGEGKEKGIFGLFLTIPKQQQPSPSQQQRARVLLPRGLAGNGCGMLAGKEGWWLLCPRWEKNKKRAQVVAAGPFLSLLLLAMAVSDGSFFVEWVPVACASPLLAFWHTDWHTQHSKRRRPRRVCSHFFSLGKKSKYRFRHRLLQLWGGSPAGVKSPWCRFEC